jgi:outer membrane protein OmpA-like peptidoglycan-associated protein
MPLQEIAMKNVILVGVAVSLFAACATAPQPSEQVEQARAEVANLAAQPLAQQAAATDLDAARRDLQRAEVAQQQHDAPAVVDHLGYLALRHAQAGEARVGEALARQQVARANEERNRILLANRTREAQNAQLQAQNAQTQADIAKSQALDAQAQLAATQQQLADLQAKKTDRGLVVTLGDVLFDTGQASLKPGADLVLGRLANFLMNNPQTKIIIEGHTDSRGSDEYNEQLSERRARSVASALVSRGVTNDSFTTVGRGKDFPVASNDTPEGRQQNRRVEIIFSDSAGKFAAQGPN